MAGCLPGFTVSGRSPAGQFLQAICGQEIGTGPRGDGGETHPHLEIAPSVRERISEKLKDRIKSNSPLIIIQTGPTWPIREWPQTAWAGLIMELNRIREATIIQFGTDNHLAMGTAEVPKLPGVVSLVNQLSLEESCALIARSHLFIGIDSGLLHIAAALQVPCVGIFGPTSPQLRLPAKDAQNCVVSRIQCQGSITAFPASIGKRVVPMMPPA